MKVLILGDFDVRVIEQHMQCFCETYNLKSLIKQSTCYKNPNSLTCVNLILMNATHSFQSTCVLETRPSEFNLMTVTGMR